MKILFAIVTLGLASGFVHVSRAPAQEHPQHGRGKAVYAQFCTQCHGVDGKRGEGFQTPIWGEGSLIASKFGNAQNLIDYMQIMPFNDPTLINTGQRLDVTAYVLANHGALGKNAEFKVRDAGKIQIK